MTGVFTFVAGEHFLLCVILPSTHLKLKGRGEEICMWTVVLENNFNAWKEVSSSKLDILVLWVLC